MNIFNKLKFGIYNGLGFVLVLGLTSVAYSAYVSISSNVNSSEPLTASLFNNVLENQRALKTTVDGLNSAISGLSNIPIGFVGTFNLSSCPNGWIPANGSNGTPDLRGEFVRGLDSGRGVDGGRALGSWQNHMLQDHDHNIIGQNGDSNDIVAFSDANTDITYAGGGSPGSRGDVYINVAGIKNGNKGAETRPRNVALLYCVKQ